MSTITAPRETVKPNGKPRPFYTLALTISGQAYGIQPNPDADPSLASKAYRLHKHDAEGTVYDVAQTPDGHACCSCPDWIARRDGTDPAGCKHVKGLRHFGLIGPAPKTGPSGPVSKGRPCPIDPSPAPASSTSVEVKPAPSQADIRRSIAFGIALPKPQGGPRAFAEGLLDSEPATVAEPCCGPAEAQPCAQCLGADDTGSFADELAEAAGPESDRLRLAEWLRLQVAFYRGFNTDAAELVAEHLAELCTEAEITRATTPGMLRDRRAALAV